MEFDALIARVTRRAHEADYRAGLLASLLANQHRGAGTAAYQISDFFPHLKPKQRRQTADDHAAIVRQLAEMYGGELSTKYTRGEA